MGRGRLEIKDSSQRSRLRRWCQFMVDEMNIESYTDYACGVVGGWGLGKEIHNKTIEWWAEQLLKIHNLRPYPELIQLLSKRYEFVNALRQNNINLLASKSR